MKTVKQGTNKKIIANKHEIGHYQRTTKHTSHFFCEKHIKRSQY